MPHQRQGGEQTAQDAQVQQQLQEIEQCCDQLRQAQDPQQVQRQVQEIRTCCDQIEQQIQG